MREILRETFRDDKTAGGAFVSGSAERQARALYNRLMGKVNAANAIKKGSMDIEVRQTDAHGHEWAVILWEK